MTEPERMTEIVPSLVAEKVRFKQLSWPIKTGIVFAWVMGALWILVMFAAMLGG